MLHSFEQGERAFSSPSTATQGVKNIIILADWNNALATTLSNHPSWT